MPAPFPSVLTPYLQSCLQDGANTLITSVLDTPANWLIAVFLRAAIFGADDENDRANRGEPDTSVGGHNSPNIVFLSFLHSHSFWVEIGKKTGLDFAALCNRKDIVYIDGLTTNVNTPATQPAASVLKTLSYSLEDIGRAIATARSSVSQSSTSGNAKPRLVVDGLDFVLASSPDITSLQVTRFTTALGEDFSNVILTVAADGPLLHNIEASATPLEIEHSVLVRTLAHQSEWVLQLRPLETGFARDVTGVFRVSRGGGSDDIVHKKSTGGQVRLVNTEWLYQVKGEGVKIWSRGE